MINVFVCFTPLHVLIMERIVEYEKLENILFIFIIDRESQQNDYYYNRGKTISNKSEKIVKTKNILQIFQKIYALKNLLSADIELHFFSGNIKSFYTRLILFFLNNSKPINLFTFDDGIGNVSQAGYFYDKNERFLFSLFFKIFEEKLLYKNITRNIIKHYTIFHDDNIYGNTVFLKLFDRPINHCHTKHTKTIKILLLSVFYEDGILALKDEVALYDEVIVKFNITHVILHPRNKFNKIKKTNISIIQSKKAAEETIIELSNQFNIQVFGFFSSALLILKNSTSHINVVTLYSKKIPTNRNLIEVFKRNKIKQVDL